MKTLQTLALTFFAFSVCACAQAPATPVAATPKPTVVGPSDKKFFKDVSEGQMLEQKLCEMARRSALKEDVKKLAEKVGGELTKGWTEFATIAQSKGAEKELAMDLKGPDKTTKEKVQKLKDDKFDVAFLDEMADASKKLAKLYENAAKTAGDAEIKAYAEKMLPTLKSHAEEIAAAKKNYKK